MLKSSVGEEMASRSEYFLEKHAFPHESYYVYYRRRNVLHFLEYSNTPAEGIFRGLARYSNDPRPNHSLATAVTKIIDMAKKKSFEREGNSVTRSHKLDLLSTLNVHNDLTMVSVTLLEDEVIASQCYTSR